MAINEVGRLAGYPPEVGGALWMMQDTRERTLDSLGDLTDAEVDAAAEGLHNTIGATLYHIAAIEADWLYADILQIDFPDWTAEWFPYDVREEDGMLTPVTGFSLQNHIARLATVRAHFLKDLVALSTSEYIRSNDDADNPSTPEWVLHHLRQHEAEHRGQIQSIRTALRSL